MGSNWLVLLKYLEVIESFLTIEILQNHRHQISPANNFLAILVKAVVRSRRSQAISPRGIERKDSPPPLLPMR